MPPAEIAYTSAADLARLIRNKTVSATEVMRATLDRADRAQQILNCFITICRDEAMRDAAAADAALARGDDVGPLHGVPLHVKDIVNTKGVRTTFGSFIHEHNVPEADSVCVARLKAAGAILFGKTTTPEFGHMVWTAGAAVRAHAQWPGMLRAPSRWIIGRCGGGLTRRASG
ncbi:MAG: amidase, partial [Sphingomonadales bacterium]|nr:amidase [Sphingomonadales bacterium]